LTTVPDFHNLPLLQQLWLDYNRLTAIPTAFINLRRITHFDYSGNPIEYINPILQRWINQIGLQNNIRKLNIYTDDQNVHNSRIQESIRQSIYRVLETKPRLDIITCIDQILKDKDLNMVTIEALVEYSKDKDIHSIIGITFSELLNVVWDLIQKHEARSEIKKVLNQEMTDSICKCFTGRLARLINSLNGFDPRVSIQISDTEAVGNIIVLIRDKLGQSYSVEIHRELFQKEMTDRGFEQTIIDEWMQFID